MSLFKKKDLQKANIIQKLLKLEPKENFMIELGNFLSAYENSLDSVSVSQIKKIAQKYKVDLEKDFIKERISILTKKIESYFSSANFSKQNYHSLKHISNILILTDVVFDTEYTKIAVIHYEQKLQQYLSDDTISESEKQKLEELREMLNLSKETANQIYKNTVKSRIDSYIKPIFSSERFSPQDEENLFNAAKRLGLTLSFPEETKNKFAKYRENWEVENGKLPILQTDIRLQDGEHLHFKTYIQWLEEKTVTKRINYSGFTYSKKIIGNIRWKVGTVIPNRIQSTELKEIDTGNMYITNKRILFVGTHENKIIFLQKILNFHPYTDGLLIEKETGKAPFLAFNSDVEKAATILASLLR